MQCTKLAIAEYVQPLFPFRQSSTVFLVGETRSQLAPETLSFRYRFSATATINVRRYVLRVEFSKRLSIQLPQLQRTHQISRTIFKGPGISWQRSPHLRSACDERTLKDGITETLTVPECCARCHSIAVFIEVADASVQARPLSTAHLSMISVNNQRQHVGGEEGKQKCGARGMNTRTRLCNQRAERHEPVGSPRKGSWRARHMINK